MPFSPAQIITGSTYSLATYQKKEPIDQINPKHRVLDWLIKNKEVSTFGNGSFKEPIYVDNNSNAQNYFGADQVTFNERDPAKWTDWAYANTFDGFWFDEDRLLAAGIHVTDDRNAVPSAGEKETLVNLLGQSYRALKNSVQNSLAMEFMRDGSQSNKAIPGLAHLVAINPATGTVGGINSSTSSYWRNNYYTAITRTDVVSKMEAAWQDCMRYGGKTPDYIACGLAFYNNYKVQAANDIARHLAVQGKGGASLDASIDGVNFHGIPLVWDPTFEEMDTLLTGTDWTNTCYFLNSSAIKLRPLKGEWMRNRKPDGLPDRFVTYFGMSTKYGLTTNQRNALAVLRQNAS